MAKTVDLQTEAPDGTTVDAPLFDELLGADDVPEGAYAHPIDDTLETRLAEWSEGDHPRDDQGQFSEGGGGGAASASSPERPADGGSTGVAGAVEHHETGRLPAPQQDRLTRAHEQARVMGGKEKREKVAMIDGDGKVVGQATGTAHRVAFSVEMSKRMGHGPKTLVATHNHPSAVSLGHADISVGSQPGVREIWAVTPSGSLYGASNVQPRAVAAFKTHNDRVVASARRIGNDRDRQEMQPFVNHLVMRGLAQEGLLTYHETLKGRDKENWDHNAALFGKWAKDAGIK